MDQQTLTTEQAAAKLERLGYRVDAPPANPPHRRFIVRRPVTGVPHFDGQGVAVSASGLIALADELPSA